MFLIFRSGVVKTSLFFSVVLIMMTSCGDSTVVSPDTGYYLGGAKITIRTASLSGSDFTSETTVMIGGRACTSVEALSTNALTCIVPSTTETPGAVDVVITTAGSAITMKKAFTYKGFERVDSIAGTKNSFGSKNGTGDVATFGEAINDFYLHENTLYVADGGSFKVRAIDLSRLNPDKVDPKDVTVSKIAGDGTRAFTDSTDDTGETASFRQPAGIFFLNDLLYVPDTDWDDSGGPAKFRTVDPETGKTDTLISSGNRAYSQLAYDGAGYFYAADCTHNRVDKIKISNGAVTLVAGGIDGYADGVGGDAQFSCPYGIAIDADREFLYVIDATNNAIRKIEIATQEVTTVVDGSAGLDVPSRLVLADQYLLVTDWENCAVQQIKISDFSMTTLAGDEGTCSSVDGALEKSRFKQLDAIWYDPTFGIFTAASTWNWADGAGDGLIRLIH